MSMYVSYMLYSYVVGLRSELNFRALQVPDWHVGQQCQQFNLSSDTRRHN